MVKNMHEYFPAMFGCLVQHNRTTFSHFTRQSYSLCSLHNSSTISFGLNVRLKANKVHSWKKWIEIISLNTAIIASPATHEA